jgi:hypothetical protein
MAVSPVHLKIRHGTEAKDRTRQWWQRLPPRHTLTFCIRIMKILCIIYGLVIQGVASGVWVLGFAAGMSGFGTSPSHSWAEWAHPIMCIHSTILFPAFVTEYYIFSNSFICGSDFWEAYSGVGLGPYPTLSSLIWCVIIGYLFYSMVPYHRKLERAEQAH